MHPICVLYLHIQYKYMMPVEFNIQVCSSQNTAVLEKCPIINTRGSRETVGASNYSIFMSVKNVHLEYVYIKNSILTQSCLDLKTLN